MPLASLSANFESLAQKQSHHGSNADEMCCEINYHSLESLDFSSQTLRSEQKTHNNCIRCKIRASADEIRIFAILKILFLVAIEFQT